jgi:hypothetical protein
MTHRARLFLLICSSSIHIIYAEQPINIHISPHINSHAISHAANMQNNSGMLLDTLSKTITHDNYQQCAALLKQIAWEKRYTIGWYTFLTGYACINGLLLLDYNFLTDKSLWSYWKHELSFAQLCNIPQKTLEKELILEIGHRNYNKKNPTDTTHPLINFIAAIDYELYRINRFIWLTSLKICFTNDTKLNAAQQHYERACFIKHIFLSWLSEYNMNQNGYILEGPLKRYYRLYSHS